VWISPSGPQRPVQGSTRFSLNSKTGSRCWGLGTAGCGTKRARIIFLSPPILRTLSTLSGYSLLRHTLLFPTLFSYFPPSTTTTSKYPSLGPLLAHRHPHSHHSLLLPQSPPLAPAFHHQHPSQPNACAAPPHLGRTILPPPPFSLISPSI